MDNRLLVMELIKKEVSQQNESLDFSTKLEDLSIDSVDMLNIIFALEEKLGINIDPQFQINKNFETIGHLIDHILSSIPEQSNQV